MMARWIVLLAVLAAVGFGAWMLLGEGPSSDEAAPLAFDAPRAADEVVARPGLAGRGALAGRAERRDVPAGEAWSVEVLVLDVAGAPAAGVPVRLRWTQPTWNRKGEVTGQERDWLATPQRRALDLLAGSPAGALRAEGTTDAAGLTRLQTNGQGNFEVRAEPAAPALGSLATIEVGRAAPPQRVTLRLLEGHEVRGRVVDTRDQGVAAALDLTVASVRGEPDRWRGERVATQADGSFVAHVPRGSLGIATTVGQRLRHLHGPFDVPRPDALTLRVPAEAGTLRVLVTDGNGVAIPRAVVAAAIEGQPRASTMGETDREGVARLLPPEGPLSSLVVECPPWLTETASLPTASWQGLVVPARGEVEVRVTLEASGSVEGTVRDGVDGPGLAAATVRVFLDQKARSLGWGLPLEAVSDSAGHYRIDGLPVGRHVITVQHATHVHAALEGAGNRTRPPEDLRVFILAGGVRVERDLVMVPGVLVEGVVVDAGDRPVVGAEVVLGSNNPLLQSMWQWGVAMNMDVMRLATSGEDGRFQVALGPDRTWRLGARTDAAVSKLCDEFTTKPGSTIAPLRLVLQPGVTLRGHVLKGEDRVAVAGAWINTWTDGGEVWPHVQRTTRSDPEGAFEVQGLPPGKPALWCSTPSGLSRQVQIESLEAGAVREGIEVLFEAGHALEVLLVDAETGTPVAGRSLIVQKQGQHHGNAVTDDEGIARFADAPAGRLEIATWRDNDSVTLATGVEVPRSDRLEVRYRDVPSQVIEGRVLDPSGAPVPMCSVEIEGSAGSGSNTMSFVGQTPGEPVYGGTFRLAAKGPPPYTVRVHDACDAAGASLGCRTLEQTLTSEQVEAGPVVLRLEGGATARLRVLDEDGAPVTTASYFTQGTRMFTQVGDDGRVEIPGLAPGAAVNVRLWAQGYLVDPGGYMVTAGEDERIVRLQRGGRIAGRMESPTGSPLPDGISIVVQWGEGATRGNTLANVQPDGSFVLEGLPTSGTVDLQIRRVSAAGGFRAAQEVTGVAVGRDDLVIVLLEGLAITGRVVDADGRPVPSAVVQVDPAGDGAPRASVNGQADGAGEFRVEGLEPGSYRLQARRDWNQRGMTRAVVADAGSRGIELRLPEAGAIRGRLLGRPAGVAAWSVTAHDGFGGRAGRARPSEDGTFELTDMDPEMTYDLWVQGTETDFYGHRRGVRARGPEVDVTLVQGGRIDGRIEGLAANAAANAWVRVEGEGGFRTTARPEDDGTFQVRGVPPGAHRLCAQVSRQPAGPWVEGVQAGAAGIVLPSAP
jgi:hypothetical protein